MSRWRWRSRKLRYDRRAQRQANGKVKSENSPPTAHLLFPLQGDWGGASPLRPPHASSVPLLRQHLRIGKYPAPSAFLACPPLAVFVSFVPFSLFSFPFVSFVIFIPPRTKVRPQWQQRRVLNDNKGASSMTTKVRPRWGQNPGLTTLNNYE